MVTLRAFSAGLMLMFLYSCPTIAQTGHPSRTSAKEGVSSVERESLIALYHATDGNNWKRHAGWLGDAGSECEWQGVTCAPDSEGSMTVEALDVGDNNLTGTIPESVGHFRHLEWLYIYGNHLRGIVPDPLIQRWLSGALEISAEESPD